MQSSLGRALSLLLNNFKQVPRYPLITYKIVIIIDKGQYSLYCTMHLSFHNLVKLFIIVIIILIIVMLLLCDVYIITHRYTRIQTTQRLLSSRNYQ